MKESEKALNPSKTAIPAPVEAPKPPIVAVEATPETSMSRKGHSVYTAKPDLGKSQRIYGDYHLYDSIRAARFHRAIECGVRVQFRNREEKDKWMVVAGVGHHQGKSRRWELFLFTDGTLESVIIRKAAEVTAIADPTGAAVDLIKANDKVEAHCLHRKRCESTREGAMHRV